ncbi:MAG: hypothetical protein KKA73_08985, partial [Chloroflexi bacterium]|nr:hypothetical protein [Chloroflexota bacterium]
TEIPDLTPEETAWIQADLAPVDIWDLEEEEAAALRERTELPELDGPWPDFAWEFDILQNSLWLHADEQFNLDHVASLARRFIRRFRPDYRFSIEWADTCSTPRTDSFGGGWAVVTATEVITGTTGMAVMETLHRLAGAYKAMFKYLVVETDAGVYDETAPQVLDTKAQLDEYLQQWAKEHGYESYDDYCADDHPRCDVSWHELVIQAGELSPDARVVVA